MKFLKQKLAQVGKQPKVSQITKSLHLTQHLNPYNFQYFPYIMTINYGPQYLVITMQYFHWVYIIDASITIVPRARHYVQALSFGKISTSNRIQYISLVTFISSINLTYRTNQIKQTYK